MKDLLFLFSFICLLSSAGCHSAKSGVQSLPQPAFEDHSSGNYSFPTGVYYVFDFGEDPGYNFEVADALAKMRANHFRPLEIWFKPGASSCTPPGSDLSMSVIVEPVLLVRFRKTQRGIEKLGYRLVEDPSAGSCAYFVRRYHF